MLGIREKQYVRGKIVVGGEKKNPSGETAQSFNPIISPPQPLLLLSKMYVCLYFTEKAGFLLPLFCLTSPLN